MRATHAVGQPAVGAVVAAGDDAHQYLVGMPAHGGAAHARHDGTGLEAAECDGVVPAGGPLPGVESVEEAVEAVQGGSRPRPRRQ